MHARRVSRAIVLALLLAAIAALSHALTQFVQRYALKSGQLDVPNERSSHVQPTPRGGGISFVLTTLLGTVVLFAMGFIAQPVVVAVLIGGSLVAVVGMIDDRRGLAARWRFLAHLSASGCAVALLTGWHAALLSSYPSPVRAAALLLAVIGGVWSINLTNFMDGIDGIAATEAITVCVGAALCAWIMGSPITTLILPLVLAAGATGFLLHNWPPARIFMGDAGSGFLGFMIATLTLVSLMATPTLAWCWILLFGVFVTDATFTITRRLFRGERVTAAHRRHGYQHLSRRFVSHRTVTLAVAVVNLCWLLPWACVVAFGWLSGVTAFVIAYTPLVCLAIWSHAGAPESGSIDGAQTRVS